MKNTARTENAPAVTETEAVPAAQDNAPDEGTLQYVMYVGTNDKDTYNKSQTGSVTYFRVDALGTANGGLTYGNKAALIQTSEDKAALAEPEEGQEDTVVKKNAENVYLKSRSRLSECLTPLRKQQWKKSRQSTALSSSFPKMRKT